MEFRIFTVKDFIVPTEAHSSIEKAVKIAGLGRKCLSKIEVNNEFGIKTYELEKSIKKDISNGKRPFCVVAALGTTGSAAVDNILEIGKICKKYNLWLHIDAAYVGSVLLLQEYRYLIEGIEYADSFGSRRITVSASSTSTSPPQVTNGPSAVALSSSANCFPRTMRMATQKKGTIASPKAAKARDPRNMIPRAAPIRSVTRRWPQSPSGS